MRSDKNYKALSWLSYRRQHPVKMGLPDMQSILSPTYATSSRSQQNFTDSDSGSGRKCRLRPTPTPTQTPTQTQTPQLWGEWLCIEVEKIVHVVYK